PACQFIVPPLTLPPSLLSPSSFTATAPPEIYTLSLHDALPILRSASPRWATAAGTSPRRHAIRPSARSAQPRSRRVPHAWWTSLDRKSTRLNSSHVKISYAVFCLKKKKEKTMADVGERISLGRL